MCDTKLTLRKRHVFLIEKYTEDVRQDEKHVPDLLESIIQPPGLATEELRQRLFERSQISSKIRKIRVSTFGFRKSNIFPLEANTTFSPSRF